MDIEIWKSIPGYEGYYEASNLGRIRSVERKIPHPMLLTGQTIHSKILKLNKDADGYFVLSIQKEGKTLFTFAHRLVAMAFIPNPDNKPCVNHKDGNKQNNHVENLEWCTVLENNRHAHRTGLHPGTNAFSNPRCVKIRCIQTGKTFISMGEAARYYGVTTNIIRNRLVGRLSTLKFTKNKIPYTFEVLEN